MPNITVNGTILLPPDLVWEDEFNWSPVTMRVTPSLTGAAIVQRAKRSDGRPITLRSESDGAWLTRSQIQALRTLEQSLPASFPLVLGDGTSFIVQFASGDGDAIQAEPVQPGKQPAAGDFFIATLKFMELIA